MRKNLLVSIIIPTYNRADLISETLNSILAQTYQNWECIIVDDGSTDNTEEVIQEYIKKDNRFQFYKRPDTHKPGGNGARNYGFWLAKGEYVNWFDSDDLMHPEKLEIQIKALENSNFNFSVCQTLVFEGSADNILGLRHEKIVSENVLEDFIKQDVIFMTPSALYSYNFLKNNLLQFDEELKAAQEWEFVCRVLYFSPQYHYTDKALVHVRKHGKSITHGHNYLFRKSNYYLARVKVFQFLRVRNVIKNNMGLNVFFKNYFIENFGRLIHYDRIKIYKLYWKSIRYYFGFFKNISIICFISFVVLTGRGTKYSRLFIN